MKSRWCIVFLVVMAFVLLVTVPVIWLNTGPYRLLTKKSDFKNRVDEIMGERNPAWVGKSDFRNRVDEIMRERNPAWKGADNNNRLVDLGALGVPQDQGVTATVREMEICLWEEGNDMAILDWLDTARVICWLDFDVSYVQGNQTGNFHFYFANAPDEDTIIAPGFEDLISALVKRGQATIMRINVRRLVEIPAWIP